MNTSTKSRQLIVISPTAPPGICGVSDYSFLTTQKIAQFYESVGIGVADMPKLSNEATFKALKVSHWQQILQEASSRSGPTDVLIHYTPTAYAQSGLSIRLIKALSRFKKANGENRLFIFFHELWSNSFQMRFHQIARNQLAKWSSHQLGELADGISVVTTGQKKDLEAVLGHTRVRLGLVGANIVPIDKDAGFRSQRQAGLWALFGLAHTRLWALQAHLPMIKRLHQTGYLHHIQAIGPADNAYGQQEAAFAQAHFGKGFLRQLGALSAEGVSAHLLEVEAAVVKQDADSLYKSGSFAALAAHGVAVICHAPTTLVNPPGGGLFQPAEVAANPGLLSSEEGNLRRTVLHDWFLSSRSWEAIGEDISRWMA
ncbi:hypothetical protein [Spirosoma sp.]|uniref:hypothetical protein n=1 Tax=Spirosoma sp. TaxID=1899569 RepID=UPI002629F898|nr:hypothetical protein [Spirosoma sp.]MCX6216342.1 hypothetical protein [Spirosoma sp.]